MPRTKTKGRTIQADLAGNRQMACFADIAENITTRIDPAETDKDVYVGLEHLDPDSLHLRRWGHPSDVNGQKLEFENGDIIFGRRRAYQRKLAVAECNGICSAHAMVLRAKPETVLPEFLPFFLQSDMFMERAIGISVGSLSPTINWKTLRVQEFPLPPKDEQRRIAEILWAADVVVEAWVKAHEAVVSLVNTLVDGFLATGLSRRGGRPREARAGELPNGWRRCKCEEVFSNPPRNGYSPKASSQGRGYPTLSIGAVRDGRVIPDGNLKYADIPKAEMDRYRLCPGDLLVVRGNGNRGLTARCGIVDIIPENCFYPDLLIRITFDSAEILPEFALLQWNSPRVHRRLLTRAKSTSGIWKVNGKDLRQHILIVPPLDEQEHFLELVNGPIARQRELEAAMVHVRILQKALLNTLMLGE